jgi:hypothetical protein
MIFPSETRKAASQRETMRERKLRSGVNWQGALKQNDLKQAGVKQGLVVPSSHALLLSN